MEIQEAEAERDQPAQSHLLGKWHVWNWDCALENEDGSPRWAVAAGSMRLPGRSSAGPLESHHTGATP